jgi:cytochrome oxidase Cu insertion factor (SCO1/SenC/PrrC family)
MLRRCVLICAVLLSTALATSSLAGQVAAVGKPAPDFTLTAQYGGPHTLSDYQGKVVMLMMIGYL